MNLDDSKEENNRFICGGIASCVNVLLVYPFHKTIFYQQLNGFSFLNALRTVHDQGLHRIYRGLLPPLLQRSLTVSIMFGTQERFQLFLDKHSPYPKSTHRINRNQTLSAIFAGLCEATLLPFERIQTILQNPKYNSRYKNTMDAFLTLSSKYGIRELYRGYQPILLRNSLGNTLYFSGRSYFKSDSFNSIFPEKFENIRNFLTGGLLGAFIGMTTFPLNVAKTKMQSQINRPTQFLPTLRLIFNESRTIGRFYAGVPANFVRSILSWGIITMVFEALVKIRI